MAQKQKDYYEEGLNFLPLGGSEEFGVNFNLYSCDGQWIAFDCGIGFADHRYPNVDILLPDPEFIEARKDKLVGLVITHAHEDHIGAVPYLWPRLKCPIYCTPFTASVLRDKFHEKPECKGAQIIEIKDNRQIDVGPFYLHFHQVTHSIPQAVATLITTKYGSVMHTGDWNLDPHPVLDKPVSADLFKAIGDKGVLAYVGDSTNAPVAGRSGSERDVEEGLAKTFKTCTGRIAITIFASNIARVRSIAKAAKASGRSTVIMGRSLHRMTSSAITNGYLKDIDHFVSEEDLGYIPTDNVVMILTGSQGEPMAALARMARGDWPKIKLGKGDTVIFSSRAIPGNEKEINDVKNNLTASAVKIIDPDNSTHKIHVSGHPYADEVRDMISWIRPEIVIPVHGERVMLEAHANIAREQGVQKVVIPSNGAVIRLAPGEPKVIDNVPTGLLAVEPNRILRADHKGISERRKLQFSGAIHISIAMNSKFDLMMDPQITIIGLIDHDSAESKIVKDIRKEAEAAIYDLKNENVFEVAEYEEEIRISVRRMISQLLGIKPKVSVHIMKV